MEEQKVILTHTVNGVNFDLVKGRMTDNNCYNCSFGHGLSGCPEITTSDEGDTLLCGSDSANYFIESLNQPKRVTEKPIEPLESTDKFTAPNMLKRASDLMIERAVQYDSPEGERSMEKITKSFNAITGHNVTEAEGWMFMVLLKLVRDNTRTLGHQDSCEDLIAYASLYGESRLLKGS
jgi:hypothetical protein